MRITAVESVETKNWNDSRFLSQKNMTMQTVREIKNENNSFAATLTKIMNKKDTAEGPYT